MTAHPTTRPVRRRRLPLYLTLWAISALMLGPLLWLLVTALKGPEELAAFPPRLTPSDPRWGNFGEALTFVDYLGYARNSLTIALIQATLATLSSALVGFGFARLRAPGKKLLFTVVLGTMMVPPVITVIPTYLLFSQYGMVDTYWPWVLWGLGGSAFLVFLFRQFFAGLPRELEEAAVLDGCGWFRIFWRIFLPLSKPALATAFVLSFVAAWGDWLAPTLLLSLDRSTLAVAVSQLYETPEGSPVNQLVAAGALMYTVPVLVMYLVMQRSFTQSSVMSGIK